MYACWHCGKAIKGAVTHHVPANYMVALKLDFARAYHPKCYTTAEREAINTLQGAK